MLNHIDAIEREDLKEFLVTYGKNELTDVKLRLQLFICEIEKVLLKEKYGN